MAKGQYRCPTGQLPAGVSITVVLRFRRFYPPISPILQCNFADFAVQNRRNWFTVLILPRCVVITIGSQTGTFRDMCAGKRATMRHPCVTRMACRKIPVGGYILLMMPSVVSRMKAMMLRTSSPSGTCSSTCAKASWRLVCPWNISR